MIRYGIVVLGAAAALWSPTVVSGQGRTGPVVRAGPIAVTLPSPRPAPGPRMEAIRPFGRRHGFGGSFGFPIIVTETHVAPAPTPVPVYYPVPVPTFTRRTFPAPPPPRPYDPTKARLLTVGGGADGGGGVMKIDRRGTDSLFVVWRGAARPTRQVTLFLADDARQALVSRTVSDERRAAWFSTERLDARVAYIGCTIEFADGSIHTTLVPQP